MTELNTLLQDTVKIKSKYKAMEPFLVGWPKQFFWDLGRIICARDVQSEDETSPCDSCPHNGKCKTRTAKVFPEYMHHARRMTGQEEDPFLVLRFKQGYSYENFPKELWNQKYDPQCLNELNHHFILNDIKKPYRVLKGQIRYYGSMESFQTSPYYQYFDIVNQYEPLHYMTALDISSQEPLFSTLVTMCKPWIESFEGTPKVIAKLVTGVTPPPDDSKNQFLKAHPKDQPQDSVAYWCCLLGELDKNDFNQQCSKCKQIENCKLIRSLKHNIHGDWHSTNAQAFLPKEYASFHSQAPKAVFQIRKVSFTTPQTFGFLHTVEGSEYCFNEECTISCPAYRTCTIQQKFDYKSFTSSECLYQDPKTSQELHLPITLFPERISICSDPKHYKNDVRAVAKVLGLAVTYGAGAFTIAKNINDTEERAQELLNNFFNRLPEVYNHIQNTKQRVLQTNQIQNLVGRKQDLSKWSIPNPNASRSENMKNLGYANRTGLNFPIQSSAADFTKLAFGRLSDMILRENLSPIWGKSIVQNQTFTYRDIKFHGFCTVHDELDMLIRKDCFDETVPPAYTLMHLGDVFKKFNVKFGFEMDVEYDLSHSFTSTSRYPTSRVYVFQDEFRDVSNIKPNAIKIEMTSLTQEILSQLNQRGKPQTETSLYNLVVVNNGQLFYHPLRFTIEDIQSLGVGYKMVNIS